MLAQVHNDLLHAVLEDLVLTRHIEVVKKLLLALTDIVTLIDEELIAL